MAIPIFPPDREDPDSVAKARIRDLEIIADCPSATPREVLYGLAEIYEKKEEGRRYMKEKAVTIGTQSGPQTAFL